MIEPHLRDLALQALPGSRLVRSWPLAGGISAQVTGLELETGDGQRQKLVARQHGAIDLAENPEIAELEFDLLRLLFQSGLPVPEPILLSESEIILQRFIEGEARLDCAGCLAALAECLAAIHAVDASSLSDRLPVKRIAWPGDSALDDYAGALRLAWPPPRERTTLLHGDFWPGNLLWQGDQIAGILDWEDAAMGDPLTDVSNLRLELALVGEPEAVEEFTDEYMKRSALDSSSLPLWDLFAVLRLGAVIPRFGLRSDQERDCLDRLHTFGQAALARL